jgi:hypothetical protein
MHRLPLEPAAHTAMTDSVWWTCVDLAILRKAA